VQPAFVAVSAAAHRLQAPLQFATVAGLRAQGLALIAAAPGAELTLDLSAVPAADSAGLALLVDWLANARAHHKTLHYAQPPPALLALARLSDVERLLAG
jgi:phospholipid transport system transporter-binding protein